MISIYLAAGAAESRIIHFSCDHVVPGDHLLPLVLSQGPTSTKLDYSFQYRDTTQVYILKCVQILLLVFLIIEAMIIDYVRIYVFHNES